MRKRVSSTPREITLRAFLESATAPIDARLDIAKRLLTALARVHEHDRVHGRLDLDAVRLAGVRSYRIVLPGDDAPRSGARDTRYSPPEGGSSVRGDVFALGMILDELLHGAPESVRAVVAVMKDADPHSRYANATVAMCALARAT